MNPLTMIVGLILDRRRIKYFSGFSGLELLDFVAAFL
jgi:hypothetical protein